MMFGMMNPITITVLGLELLPAVAFGFASERVTRMVANWPRDQQMLVSTVFAAPYIILAAATHTLHWQWLAFYLVVPVATTWLLAQAAAGDPQQHGNWRDAVILLALGLAVDLRWLDVAWPTGLRGLGNLLLVNASLYGFIAIRRLSGMGFDFHLRWTDWKTGLRELLFFAPVVLILGLTLGFIHPHANAPPVGKAALAWAGIFVFVAIPEELFFRAWVQNFLERRLGRWAALIVASILFGLSHFNKRNPTGAHFNWHYILIASFAGIFYGRAWRDNRRIPASTITHTFVDWLWSWWF